MLLDEIKTKYDELEKLFNGGTMCDFSEKFNEFGDFISAQTAKGGQAEVRVIKPNISEEQTNELLADIDDIARTYDHYEYGLPLGERSEAEKMQLKIRDWYEAL